MMDRNESVKMDRIKSLIEKLSRLSKSSNIHEAELAATRMQDILMRYNLSLSDIELEKDDVEREAHTLGGSSCERTWRGILHERIARYNFCRSIRVSGSFKMAVVGKKHNLEVVSFMYVYLSTTIWRLAKESANQAGLGLSGRYTYLNSFASGAVASIESRLKEARDNEVKKSSKCRDLVVVQDALVEKKFNDDFAAKMIKQKPAGDFDASGYLRGKEAGAKIGLHQGVRHQEGKGVLDKTAAAMVKSGR